MNREVQVLVAAMHAEPKELAGRIDTGRMHAPSFLMVLTGTDSYAYQRKDGVYVVPLGCLRE